MANSITELKTKNGQSTGLVAVVVPKDAHDFTVGHKKIVYYIGNTAYNVPVDEPLPHHLPLGLVTPDTIGFYCGDHVKKSESGELFMDYNTNDKYISNSIDSFRSLLAVNGLYWKDGYNYLILKNENK